MNIEQLQQYYQSTGDILFKKTHRYSLIYCEGLCDNKLIEKEILSKLNHFYFKKQLFSNLLTVEPLKTNTYQEFDELLFSGFAILYYHKHYYSLNLINAPKRTPDQSNIDITITGPKDSFIENLETNVALIRKRLKTHALHNEYYTVGQHTKTKIALLYMDQANQKDIELIQSRLEEIKDTDLVSSGQFRNLIYNPSKNIFFPRMTYTSRPDYCVDCLLKGKFILLVDNFNNANIGPIHFTLFLELSDDLNDHFITTWINRCLYYFSGFIAVFLMPLIIGIYSYHPQALPFLWLANILSIQKGMIVPTYLEIIIATLLFELFRVAGTRLPAGISTTLLVIGSVLLGQNITSSGFIGYDILFLSAFSIICNYSVSNNISLSSVLTVFKILCFICALFLGLYGFFLSVIFITLYLCKLKSFNTDLIHFTPPFSKMYLKKVFQSINYLKKERS